MVTQFQSPIPDMQQIMKKIQDKEGGEKEKKETNRIGTRDRLVRWCEMMSNF